MKRFGCRGCSLIEPEPGVWVDGFCPHCLPHTPKPPAHRPIPGRPKGGSANNRIDLVGIQFGRLTVVGFAFTRGKRAYWNCRCECGRDHIALGAHLRRGGSRSCGCLRDELLPALGRKTQAIRRRNALASGIPRQLSPDFSRAKLNADQVLAIRSQYAQGGITHEDLAAKYGVSDSAISALLRQESWRDVGGPLARRREKLTADSVRALREEYAAGGISHERLADKFGVTRTAVTLVIQRKNWRHVT